MRPRPQLKSPVAEFGTQGHAAVYPILVILKFVVLVEPIDKLGHVALVVSSDFDDGHGFRSTSAGAKFNDRWKRIIERHIVERVVTGGLVRSTFKKAAGPDTLPIGREHVDTLANRATQIRCKRHRVDAFRNLHENMLTAARRRDVVRQRCHVARGAPGIEATAYSFNSAVLLVQVENDDARCTGMHANVESLPLPLLPIRAIPARKILPTLADGIFCAGVNFD